MDGAALAQSIRETRASMPILIITGYTGITDEALNLPRLAKPFGQVELARALTNLVADDGKILRFPGNRR
jgi:ActR/RegA family two-component response regulator